MCVPTSITQIKRSHDTTCYGYNKERHWHDNVDVLLEKDNLDADHYAKFVASKRSHMVGKHVLLPKKKL